MRQSPGHDPLNLRLWQIREVAPYPARDQVASEGPHPKGDRQSLCLRFALKHRDHRIFDDFNPPQVLDHGKGDPIVGEVGEREANVPE
jgi:hypothetical protein